MNNKLKIEIEATDEYEGQEDISEDEMDSDVKESIIRTLADYEITVNTIKIERVKE